MIIVEPSATGSMLTASLLIKKPDGHFTLVFAKVPMLIWKDQHEAVQKWRAMVDHLARDLRAQTLELGIPVTDFVRAAGYMPDHPFERRSKAT